MHDNAVLNWAINQPNVDYKEFVPVYCFDPRFYDSAVPKFAIQRKTGIHRTRFQLESVQDFRESLNEIGSNLLVSHEKPETFFKSLVVPGMMNTVVY